MNIQALPPKMTEQYAARARKGDYEYKLASAGQTDENAIYIWFVGNMKVVLIGYNSPTGHIEKIPQQLLESTKESIAQYKKS